jgi:hypothetical protein
MENKLRYLQWFLAERHVWSHILNMLGIWSQSVLIQTFLFRSGSWKELWQFTVNYTPSCSKIRRI